MFGWKRRERAIITSYDLLEAQQKAADALCRARNATRSCIGWQKVARNCQSVLHRTTAKARGRAATIRRLLENLGELKAEIDDAHARAAEARAERDAALRQREWIVAEAESLEAERDAALEALHTIAERFGEVVRLLEGLRQAD